MYTYLTINLLVILPVVYLSFDKRLDFYKQFKYLGPALVLTMFFFIPWDVMFTRQGVWGFNHSYITGIKISNLPLEEWLFFITVPYACLFTFEVIGYYFGYKERRVLSHITSLVLIVVLSVLAYQFNDRMYTVFTFAVTAVFIAIHQYYWKSSYLGNFYLSYLFILIPFLMVNGLLTGMAIPDEVVWYNPEEFMGFRIFTIPVEDSIYGLLLVLMNLTYYQKLKELY